MRQKTERRRRPLNLAELVEDRPVFQMSSPGKREAHIYALFHGVPR
ncbi:MAG: hypothetical protein GX594_01580 [Pirellulaceae bacterium]|nr:hypothetical protein [Pirellulaceae bacterium]